MCPRYDTKPSNDEASVMLELWGMWSTLLLPSLPSPLWPGVIALDRILSMGQIEINFIITLNWIMFLHLTECLNWVIMLNWTVWNRTIFDD